jgi:hypothetical protein
MHTYPVSKDRLEALRTAMSAGSDELALGIFLFSVGITAIVTLATAEIKYSVFGIGFCAAAFLGPSVGILFVCKWFRSRRQGRRLIDDILQSPEEKRKPLK